MNKRMLFVACAVIILLAACQPAAPVPDLQVTEPPSATATHLPTTAPSPIPTLPISPSPTAVLLPSPTVKALESVDVTAFCTTIGKDVKTYVKPGTRVYITWGWSAKTEEQVNDFLENNITEITLDGKVIEGKKMEGILRNQTSGEPEVVWYSDAGVLETGQHVVTYDVTFKKMIDDGHSSYGPGSKNEASHDRCEIMVEDVTTTSPADNSAPGMGSTQTRPLDGMVMVYVPAGPFIMGSDAYNVEKPIHQVTLDAFWIDRTEVTNAMFEKYVQATNYRSDAEKAGKSRIRDTNAKAFVDTPGVDWQHPQGPQTDLAGLEDHPVVHVSWNDAAAYCGWVGGRLPSEAEWEKAARGPDGSTYPWGEAAPNEKLLNFSDVYLKKSAKDGYLFTTPAGSYPSGASVYGAVDMAGNVWEWVEDWFSAYPGNQIPDEHFGTKDRVMRGGSWFNVADNLRSAYRYISVPALSSITVGFRCVSSK